MAELLSAFLPILLMKAGRSLLKGLSFMGGIEGRRKKLHLLLLAINDVIADAEEQASKRPAVKSWIAQLKLAAWEADDALDELHYEALLHDARSCGHKVNSGVKGFFSPRYNHFLLDYKIGKRLQKVTEKISDLVLQMNQFGLIKLDEPVTMGDRMQTHSYVDEEEVIGRDRERQELVHMLLHANGEKLSIIPIVGIGGLGKTTLAQIIFNDTEVKAHYQKHMWVCVSEDFDVPAIVKKIIDSAVGSDCGLKNDNMELLQQRLRQELSHKRYFLVLDDVWNDDVGKWDDLKSLLGCCARGSAVIVTTRSLKVASIMGTLDPFRLKHLSPEESWIIFSRKAFVSCSAESSEFVVVGKKIVLKCGGIPLAVKSMGGLMSSKLDIRDWRPSLKAIHGMMKAKYCQR